MKVKRDFAKCYHQVVDTNVLLSAALSPQGTLAKLLNCLLVEGGLVLSETTFSALEI